MVDTARQAPEMLKKAAPSALTPGGKQKDDYGQTGVPGSFPQEQQAGENPEGDDVASRTQDQAANGVGEEGKASVQGAFNVDNEGQIIGDNDEVVGKLAEGQPQDIADRSVKEIDREGNLKTEGGSIVGKGDIHSDVLKAGDEAGSQVDPSILKSKKVNKAGNVVDEDGTVLGRVETGDVKNLVGKTVDEEGNVWNESGKVIGTVKALPEKDRASSAVAPFEDFPDATVESNGNVVFEGKVIGKVTEGDPKKLANKKVDQDGEIVDKVGNVLGKAERWEEEPVPEPEAVDLSALAGKRVNKLGNLVDNTGAIYGRIVEGDPKKLAGKMCDKDGNIWNEGGDIVGKAELVPESEREGQKEGIFSGFEGLTVDKNGKVVDAKGTIVGRIIEGDAKKLHGKAVDEDGDILDKNGNALGKAERWEEEEKEKPHNPLAGRKVNRDGNVVDDNGDIIGKLTEGTITNCVGMEIDEDGDIVNSKGNSIGHATLLENIPPEEPGESEEEAEKRKQLEEDKKLAGRMATCIQQSIDKLQPILRMITSAIDDAEKQPKEELDEQKLVDTVRPLIEEGGKVLQEANGVIRGLDPDGRISSSAKQRTASREATPEEYHLADLLKELSENVSQTIENAKRKIAGMPHAKKELNPLWGLLAEPLGQILAAVGLLLSGVLGLVGRLLSGLGLSGLVDNLLGGLGLKSVLENLGLGSLTDSLTGKKK